MEKLIEQHQILWGIGSVVIGLLFLLWNLKFPTKGDDILNVQFRGYLAAGLFVVIGVFLICDKLEIKFIRNEWLWIIICFAGGLSVLIFTINKYDNNVEKMSSEQQNGFAIAGLLLFFGLVLLLMHMGSRH